MTPHEHLNQCEMQNLMKIPRHSQRTNHCVYSLTVSSGRPHVSPDLSFKRMLIAVQNALMPFFIIQNPTPPQKSTHTVALDPSKCKDSSVETMETWPALIKKDVPSNTQFPSGWPLKPNHQTVSQSSNLKNYSFKTTDYGQPGLGRHLPVKKKTKLTLICNGPATCHISSTRKVHWMLLICLVFDIYVMKSCLCLPVLTFDHTYDVADGCQSDTNGFKVFSVL